MSVEREGESDTSSHFLPLKSQNERDRSDKKRGKNDRGKDINPISRVGHFGVAQISLNSLEIPLKSQMVGCFFKFSDHHSGFFFFVQAGVQQKWLRTKKY